jgi:hypothetical protein
MLTGSPGGLISAAQSPNHSAWNPLSFAEMSIMEASGIS